MTEFQRQFQEIKNHLLFEDYTLLIKRIIDLTLDTEDIAFYKKTNALLDWLDQENHSIAGQKEKFESILQELHDYLSLKEIPEKELLVSTNAIRKSYMHDGFALGPVDLNLYQGHILGLVGENGNGKTTLLRLICGELYPTSGSLDYHFQYQDAFDLRTQLVYIPQRTDSWKGSMLENLLFTAAAYGYTPEENELVTELIIARLNLRPYRNHQWKNLSSGYKMRFELARMLLRKPKILLIDEPLANLDILAQQTVLEDFRAIAKSPFRPLAIILSSQQLYEVEKTSDQVIFLKNGTQKNLHATDTPDAIVEEKHLVIEFESEWSQSELTVAFGTALLSLKFNGGTYIGTFSVADTIYDFLAIVTAKRIPLNYFRNISNSTRRFFVS